jgi:hypothetical protein
MTGSRKPGTTAETFPSAAQTRREIRMSSLTGCYEKKFGSRIWFPRLIGAIPPLLTQSCRVMGQ